jgi:Putative MetA-pathway of phenol degradation
MDSQVKEKGPKVLFEWAEGEKEKNKEENEDKKTEAEKDKTEAHSKTRTTGFSNDSADEPDEIVTDRPDFTEASSTVGKGHLQLETGYTYFQDRGNGQRFHGNSYPEILLRAGMFAEWFELRIGQNFANEVTNLPDGSRQSVNGASDLYLGVKLGLTEQKAFRPEMALVLQMTIPTGDDSLSSGGVLPGANFLYNWEIIKDSLAIGGSTQGNKYRGDFIIPGFMGVTDLPFDNHSYMVFAQSVTVNYTLTKKLGAFTEWFAFFPMGAEVPDVGPEYYMDGGFTYKLTPMFQLDIRTGVGLNQHAADFFAGTGFAVKF